MRSKIAKAVREMCADYGYSAVARRYGCSHAQMHRIATGESGSSVDGLMRLSVWYANRGDRRLARLFDASRQAALVLVDGSVDDEAIEIHDATTDMRRAYRTDPTLFMRATSRMRQLLTRAEAEGEATQWRVAR